MTKMKGCYLALCLTIVVASVTGNVLDLGDTDFDSTLEGHDLALVMFYAPW